MISAPPADAQWFSSTPTPLAEIEETVAERHDDIAHVEPEDFVKMQAAGEEFILLDAVSYTHLRAHETSLHLVCRLLLEKKKK